MLTNHDTKNYGARYEAPVGRDGTRWGIGWSQSSYDLNTNSFYNSLGQSRGFSFYGLTPVYRDRMNRVTAIYGYDHRKIKDRLQLKESIFSGLNNVNVNSLLDKRYSDFFGFTDAEVNTMAAYYQATDKSPEIKEWYDGYRFGNTEIYNPWSVLKYFNNYCEAEPYWVQTSENSTIREIISGLDNSTCENLRALLNGSAVESIVDTNIIYPKLKEQQTNIFGFLLMTGYLKSIKTTRANGICLCELSIPNKEIKSVYSQEIVALLADKIDSTAINLLQQYLITKNGPALQNVLKKFLLETVSYYDTLKENYYQGLLLGMTGLFTNTYYISSNRESGEGRYDIQLLPKNIDMPGIIIEIKATADSSDAGLKKLAAEALTQIEDKKYDTELRKQNIKTIYKYGIAFSGKKVEILTN